MRRSYVKKIGVTLPAALVLSLGLTACGSDPEPVITDGANTASGEVLEGSISDAMLPLDTIQSQSPPLSEAPSDEAD